MDYILSYLDLLTDHIHQPLLPRRISSQTECTFITICRVNFTLIDAEPSLVLREFHGVLCHYIKDIKLWNIVRL